MSNGRIRILHAVTASISVVLMRGQLSYLRSVGFDPGLLSSPGRELTETGELERFAVVGLPMKREIAPIADLRSLIRLVSLLRRIRPVICNAGTPKAGLLVGLAARITRIPCRIYTLRGLRLETAKGGTRMLLTVTEKLACSCAHRVVCVSPSLQRRVIDLGIAPPSKTIVLGAGSSNGVEVSRFEPTPEKTALAAALRDTLGIKTHQPVIGFAGRLTRDKGIPELLTAFELIRHKMPESVLLLVGDYESGDPVPAEIRQRIESDPAICQVAFTSQIELYYHLMTVFVLPTYREGFPNTVLEAQAARLPVVTTTATGAADAIEDGVTGSLIPVGDSSRLADAVLAVLLDPGKKQSMGNLGKERVLRQFSNQAVWQSLASLYASMLRERGYAMPEYS
jgi:glycosyltransferase involved in cell wall biosynthesis